MPTKILVTFASAWTMDNGTSGTTLNFFFWGEHGELLESRAVTDGAAGVQRAKVSMDRAARNKITYVPGLYDAIMGFKVGSDGKPVYTVDDIMFDCPVEIKPARPAQAGQNAQK